MDKQQNELLKSYFRSRSQADEIYDDEMSYNKFSEEEKAYILTQSNQFQKYVYKDRMIPIENSPYFVVDMHKIEESEFYFDGYQIWPTLKFVNEHFHDVDPKKIDPNALFNSIKDLPKYKGNDGEENRFYWDDPKKKNLITDIKRFFNDRGQEKFSENIEDVIPKLNAIVLKSHKNKASERVIDFNGNQIDLTKYDLSLDKLVDYSLETPYIAQKLGADIDYSNRLKNGTYLVGGNLKGNPETLHSGFIIDKNFNDAKDEFDIQDITTNGDIWYASSALVGKPIKDGELKTISGVPQLLIKDKDNKRYVARMGLDEYKIEVIEIPTNG